MIDTRSGYRMVSTSDRYDGRIIYRLEYRPHWAFAWRFVGCVKDEQEARQRATAHASPPQIIGLGRFPKRDGEL